MSVIQNQQTDLLVFLSINGTEITEHNRKYSSSQTMQTSDVETAAGRIKRFYRKNKRTLSLTFSYLPTSSEKTVDGREARDFIENLAMSYPLVSVSYIDQPGGSTNTFDGYINNYTEKIVRKDYQTQCIYYDISFEIEEK